MSGSFLKSNNSAKKHVVLLVQGGPLPLLNGVITRINGFIHGFALGYFTPLSGVFYYSMYNDRDRDPPCREEIISLSAMFGTRMCLF